MFNQCPHSIWASSQELYALPYFVVIIPWCKCQKPLVTCYCLTNVLTPFEPAARCYMFFLIFLSLLVGVRSKNYLLLQPARRHNLFLILLSLVVVTSYVNALKQNSLCDQNLKLQNLNSITIIAWLKYRKSRKDSSRLFDLPVCFCCNTLL